MKEVEGKFLCSLFKMSVGVENEGCIMITSSFTEMYNKWLHELTNIETNLVCKAKEIQQLQNSLNNEAENVTI